jgi:UDP-N-acetylmuramoyl-tripeptide--D-alanyl-D-alanine ligase
MSSMLTLKELSKKIGGEYIGRDCLISAISFNSNDIKSGDIFVAIKADRDGHDYIKDAIQRGAIAVIVSKKQEKINLPQVIFKDTRRALGKLASIWRSQFNIPVIAITGSCGKTTTKDILGGILSIRGQSVVTYKNFNNDIGVPITLFKITKDTKYAVIEMGTNSSGEIGDLVKIVKPTHAIITNISGQHLEGLKTLNGVLREKFDLFKGLSNESVAFVNYDEIGIKKLSSDLNCKQVSYSLNQDIKADINFVGKVNRNELRFKVNGEIQDFSINLLGSHNVQNVMAALACSSTLKIPLTIIRKGLRNILVTEGRFNRHVFNNNIIIIDDTYNASLASVEAAVNELDNFDGNKIFIMTDMSELGSKLIDSHLKMGELIFKSKIDSIYLFGDTSVLENIIQAAPEKDIILCRKKDDILESLFKNKQIRENTMIVVKGARKNKMEYIVSKVIDFYS